MSLFEKEPKKPYLTTKPSEKSFQTSIERDFLGHELKEKLLATNLLFVPNQGYMDKSELLYFTVGTSDLHQYIIDKNIDGLRADICLEEKDYKEVALHADWLIIAEFIVKEVVAPLFVALLAEYIMKKLGNKKEETNIKSKFTLVDEKTGEHTEYKYEGPAKDYRSIMLHTISKASPKGLPIPAELKIKRKRRTKKKRS